MAQPRKKNHILPALFGTFLKIGAFTFGGGYAMLPLIDSVCVEKKGWLTHEEFMDVTAIAESTPGPLSINAATYIGYRQAGLPGAVSATLGVVLPSFVILYLISLFFDNLLAYPIISNAFKGIKIGVGVLILQVAFKMIKKMEKKIAAVAIMSGALILSLCMNIFSLRISSIYLIIAAALSGLLIYLLGTARKKRGGTGR